MQTIAAFDRIGEENAFAVLARATALAAQGRDIINLGIGQPDFRTPEQSSRRRSRRCATAITATRRRTACCRCARRWPPICTTASRSGVARRSDDHARRQADHVHVDPDVRRARRRNPLSRSRLSDLSLDDRVHRRAARCRCRSARRTALPSRPRRRWPDHAADAAADPQLAGQPDRRRHAARPRSTSWSPGSSSFPTSPSCPTRSTTT